MSVKAIAKPEVNSQPAAEDIIHHLPVHEIEPGDNDRKIFEEAALESLAASLKEQGLLQAITVRPFDGNGSGTKYQIICGERRWRAAKLLEWPTIRATIKECDSVTASCDMLTENLKRADLSPLEEARAYDKRMAEFGWDRKEMARRAGVHEGTVRHRLALLKLCDEAQQLLVSGDLPNTHAFDMAVLDHERQLLALRAFRSRRTPPLKEFQALVRELRGLQEQGSMFETTELFLERQEVSAQSVGVGGAGVKTDPNLPLPPNASTVGVALEACITSLVAAGRAHDALLVATIYDYLVRRRLAICPGIRKLPPEMMAST